MVSCLTSDTKQCHGTEAGTTSLQVKRLVVDRNEQAVLAFKNLTEADRGLGRIKPKFARASTVVSVSGMANTCCSLLYSWTKSAFSRHQLESTPRTLMPAVSSRNDVLHMWSIPEVIHTHTYARTHTRTHALTNKAVHRVPDACPQRIFPLYQE